MSDGTNVQTANGPKVRVWTASVKRASTPAAAASLSAANWQVNARQKPLNFLGPSVAPVVFFCLGAGPIAD